MDIVEVKNLTKVYPPRKNPVHALRGISFDVAKGEIFGILGVNGAGKSTTLNILIGLLSASGGSIKIFGKDFFRNEEEVKNRMNIATAYADLANTLTVYQNLKVFALMYGLKDVNEKIRQSLVDLGITSLRDQRVDQLSAGQRTRVNLCKALLNEPEVLLLDEPTASLDPSIAARVRKMLLGLQRRKKMTIIVTSHNMAEVEQMCDRVALMHQGRIYMIDTPEKLIKYHGSPDLEDVFIKLAKGEIGEDEGL